MTVHPVTLEGSCVRLEPLTMLHHDSLCIAGLDPELWRLSTTLISTPEDMREYIEAALTLQRDGSALPFAIIHRPTGVAVGSTRYGNIDFANKRAEIG